MTLGELLDASGTMDEEYGNNPFDLVLCDESE